MRIGFVTQLLWHRYGGFWLRLFEEAGAEILLPDREVAAGFLDDPRVAAVPALSFRLAIAQAFALQEADVIVAPSLNWRDESPRGGGQDPWVADFPGSLGTLGGLPTVLAVPAWLASDQESLVVESLQQVVRDSGSLRRVWTRHKAGLRHDPLREPSWGAGPPGRATVAVVGQPWLLTEALVGRAVPAEARSIPQYLVDPFRLREEGSRVDPKMIASDREVMGAAHLFARRGNVDELHLVVDEGSGADLWLRDRIVKQTNKPTVVHRLRDLLGDEEPGWLLAQENLG